MTLEVTVGELKEQPVASAKAEEPGGNWGMQVGDITPEIAQPVPSAGDKGVVVRHVAPDSPAADAGMQPGDVVLEINHDKVATVKDFVAKAKAAKTGKKPALLLVAARRSDDLHGDQAGEAATKRAIPDSCDKRAALRIAAPPLCFAPFRLRFRRGIAMHRSKVLNSRSWSKEKARGLPSAMTN